MATGMLALPVCWRCMCRFVLYLGPPITLSSLLTEPEHSIVNQSVHARERAEPLNGDGFGVAWYAPEIHAEAARFRSITPAWSNQNLRHLARMTRSGCVLAHVRAASPGLAVTETNAHPFVWKRYAFMHNGQVGGFAQIKRKLLDGLADQAYGLIEGTTDSEHLFALFVHHLLRTGSAPEDAMAGALVATIENVLALCEQEAVGERSDLNLALSDGEGAVVCRFASEAGAQPPSLYVHTGKAYACEAGACRMLDPGQGGKAVIIASEPLSRDAGWTAVEPGNMIIARADGTVETRSLA